MLPHDRRARCRALDRVDPRLQVVVAGADRRRRRRRDEAADYAGCGVPASKSAIVVVRVRGAAIVSNGGRGVAEASVQRLRPRRSWRCRSRRDRRSARVQHAEHAAVVLPLQPSPVVPVTSATLPAAPLKLIGVGSRQSRAVRIAAPVAPARLADEEVLPRLDRAAQLGELAGVGAEEPGTRCARVLNRQSRERHIGRRWVVELDVVARERSSGVAAASVDLADHEPATGGERISCAREREQYGNGCGQPESKMRRQDSSPDVDGSP